MLFSSAGSWRSANTDNLCLQGSWRKGGNMNLHIYSWQLRCKEIKIKIVERNHNHSFSFQMLKNSVSSLCFFSGSTTYLQSTVPIIVTIHPVPAVRVSRRAVTICEKFWVKWAAHHFIGMMFKIITTKSIIATKSNTRTTLSFPNHSTILSYLEILHHHPPNSTVSEWGNHDSSHSRSILCSEEKPQKKNSLWWSYN